jgi:phosphoglycolate phosphatase
VLESLTELGVELAVATLKPRRFAQLVTEHAGLRTFFHTVTGPESDHSRESKADIITETLKSLNLHASAEILMIGDREQDSLGAHDTGTLFIGALWGFGSRHELQAAHATQFAESPYDLLEYFSSLLQSNPRKVSS